MGRIDFCDRCGKPENSYRIGSSVSNFEKVTEFKAFERLELCKSCRVDLMKTIEKWVNEVSIGFSYQKNRS